MVNANAIKDLLGMERHASEVIFQLFNNVGWNTVFQLSKLYDKNMRDTIYEYLGRVTKERKMVIIPYFLLFCTFY